MLQIQLTSSAAQPEIAPQRRSTALAGGVRLEDRPFEDYPLIREPAHKLLTVEEFLDSCPNDIRHYKLFDGVIVAMGPPAIAHQTIAATLAFELVAAVRGNRLGSAVGSQAGIAPQGLTGRNYFEADIVVTCRSANDYRSINAEPLLIVEIQSPSTERDDHFIKLPQYQAIPSVQEILYIESERIAATIQRRSPAGLWQAIEIAGPQTRLQLQTIGLDIPLAAVYPSPHAVGFSARPGIVPASWSHTASGTGTCSASRG